MTALHEIHSFVNKFLNLCNNGERANLNLKCQDGKAVINLQLDLDAHVLPPYHQHQRTRVHPTPSRVRRSARRAQARADKIDVRYPSKSEPLSTAKPLILPTAEKADAENDASVKTDIFLVHNQLSAEQAVRDAAADHQHLQQRQPEQAHGQDLHSDELCDSTVPEQIEGDGQRDDKDAEKEMSKPLETLNMNEFVKLMEDIKNNITDGLREGLSESFKPP